MSEARSTYRLREILEVARSPIEMRDEENYMLASIRRRNGGMFDRETKKGNEILTKTLSRVIPGSFVISKMQVVHGACGMAPHDFGDRCISASYVSLLPREPQRIDIGYLDAYATTKQSYDAFIKASHGVHIEKMTFSLEDWLNGEIEIPPLPEQKKIAEILSGIDNLIASKERQISALKNLQKSLLDALVEDQLGSGIPCVELNDVISPDRKITYGIVQAGPHTPGGVPYIRVTDMSRDQLEPNEMLRTTEELALKFKRSEVKEGDVVVALRGIIGASHLIDKRAAGCNLTQGTALLSRSEKCDPCYLNTILKSEYCRKQFAQLAKGSTIVEITLSSLGTIKVPLPERVEQERVARIVDTMQSQIRHGNEMLSSYKTLKAAISSDLLSGRKRVTP